MTATAVVLILVSVVLHVLWNAVAKGRPTFAFFYYGNLIGAAILLPVIFWHASALAAFPPVVWLILACAGVAQTIGGLTLMRAYREADLSVAYPLVRSLGPVFVVLGSLALGRSDAIGAGCLLGIFAILVGSIGLGLSNMRALGQRTVSSTGLLWCIAAALGTMGYTLFDDAGVRHVLDSGALEAFGNAPFRSGLLYASIEGWATFVGMTIWLLRKREHRDELRAYTSKGALRDAVIMGVGSYAAYALVLISMLYVSDVSYVAGFRQLSVPLGAAVGVLSFGERIDLAKGSALLLMVAGLLAIALA